MAVTLNDKLVVAISSRALFDLEVENRIFEGEGLYSYSEYQRLHEDDILFPGTGFSLVKALHKLNANGQKLVEIIIISRNSADTSLRIFNSLKHYGLDVTRAALLGGVSVAPYLPAFKTDLFLSANEEDVQEAINANIAAGIICDHGNFLIDPLADITEIKIAFDGDSVLFSDESERIFQEKGLEAFSHHEETNAREPMVAGPFAKFLKTISLIQTNFPRESTPIRTALVTARGVPAHERAIRTLRTWNVRVDEAFFLGGVEKTDVLKAFNANIFFDDQKIHIDKASQSVPSARVPIKQA